jgi:hypothetical protein
LTVLRTLATCVGQIFGRNCSGAVMANAASMIMNKNYSSFSNCALTYVNA